MCLARTIVIAPDVLLLDEPTSALDPGATRELERNARQLAAGGMPLLWVTHDLRQVERLADELVVLIGGRPAGDDDRVRFLRAEHPVEPLDGCEPPAPTAGEPA